jgi:hypothetical protein
MEISDDIIDMLIDIINLTGQFIEKCENNEIEYNEELENKIRRLVIMGTTYAVHLEELMRR